MTIEEQNAELLRQNAELVEKIRQLKIRMRAMQDCAKKSQELDWSIESDIEMERLYFYAHADHSDILVE